MNASDVSPGDMVKSGHNARWGRVVDVMMNEATGQAALMLVVPKHSNGHWSTRTEWWLAGSVSEVERGGR